MDDLAIWWLTQSDCEAIGDRPPKRFPRYMRDQYRSRYGRSGRARLWADEKFGPVLVAPWPKTAIACLLEMTSAGGVVVRRKDVDRLATLPGTITDFKLERI